MSLIFGIIFCIPIVGKSQISFPTSFQWIKDSVYIDSSAPNGGNGTIDLPYNELLDITFNSNTAYFFKRGSEFITSDFRIGADYLYFGAYGDRRETFIQGNNWHSCIDFFWQSSICSEY